MERRYSFLIYLCLILVDILISNASFFAGYLMAHHTISLHQPAHYSLNKLLVFNIGWLGISSALGLYSRATITRLQRLFRRTMAMYMIHTVFFAVFLICAHEWSYALDFLPACYSILLMLLGIRNFIVSTLKRVIKQQVKSHPQTYIVSHSRIDQTWEIEEYIQFAAANNIREIYATDIPERQQVHRLMELADQHCVRVKFMTDRVAADQAHYHVEYMDNIPVICMRSEPLSQNFGNILTKRLFDLIFSSLVILFILSWMTPLLWLLIKLDSKGPGIFRQKRTGRDNRPFWCYKFRSMRVNDASDHLQARRNDPRITRLGAALRKTNLDEMPQFFNVFLGQMSVVGPRPHMLKHTEEYRQLINKYMVRQFLQPGITGWAQIHGYRGETRDHNLMVKRVEFDIYYMEHWSLALDIKIVWFTIVNLFRGEENAC